MVLGTMAKVYFLISVLQKNIIPIIGVFAYGLTGILLMFIALYIFERMVQCNIKDELADRNFSVGVSVAAILLGAAIISAAAIKGRPPSSKKHSVSSEGGCGQPHPLAPPLQQRAQKK